MLSKLAFAALFIFSTAAASAQIFPRANPNDGMQPARDQIHTQTRGSVFPGPRQGETRVVWVWRPANAPTNQRLPTLYIFDGLDGLNVALLRLKPAFDSGALPAILLIAPDPNPRGEARGGFSNGADLALVLANDHPNLFGGALLHSPVGAQTAWITQAVAHLRFVVTGGTRETAGSVHRPADVPREVIESLQRLNAPLRACIGPWRHEGPAWRDLSPGSLVWLMGLGDPNAYASEPEQRFCHNTP